MREPDGLALSSRNVYLSQEERRVAPLLHRALNDTAAALAAAPDDVAAALQNAARGIDARPGSRRIISNCAMPQICRREPARPPGRLLAAAHLGRTRLIDNIPVLPR